MHAVHLNFESEEDAKWVHGLCQRQIENPAERINKLQIGIMIDSIRKSSSVSQTSSRTGDKASQKCPTHHTELLANGCCL